MGKIATENLTGVPMEVSDTQVLIALVVALVPAVMALRLSTALYK